MYNYIQYGGLSKATQPFYGDNSIIQQFSLQGYSFLSSVLLYIGLNKNSNHDFPIQILIVDEQENIYCKKQFSLQNVFSNDYYEIPMNVKLDNSKNYFLCIDSYGHGDVNNNVCFYLGYRKKMMNFFLNNKFSLGQLCFKLKVK